MKKSLLISSLLAVASFSHATTYVVNVGFNNAESVDGFNDPDNATASGFVGLGGHTNHRVTGLAWDLEIRTVGASWLSEVKIGFGTSFASPSLFLTPGIGDNFSGTKNYSNTMVDLVALNLDFSLEPSQTLFVQLFEGFDDGPGTDAFVNGTVQVQIDADPVPEPATLAVLGLGALAMKRRRK